MEMQNYFTKNIMEEMRKNFPNIDGWFYSLKIEYDKNTSIITVGFPHKFFSHWFFEECEEYFTQSIQKASTIFSVKTPTIKYLISKEEVNNENNVFHNTSILKKNQFFFETFIHNSKNEFPLKIAREISEKPFEVKHNPIIFFGKNCTGKTTLLQCIHSFIVQHHFHENLIFMGNIEDLIKNLTINAKKLINKYSFFIIDNIHDEFIKEYQNDFHEFIRECNLKKKQVICGSTKNYKNKLYWIENLRNSINSNLLLQVKESDIDVRMRYALVQCQKINLHLKKEYILLIAQRCNSICTLHAILLKVNVFIKVSKTAIQRKDIENILNSEDDEIQSLTPNTIISFVASYFEMTEEIILSNKKNPDIVHARYVAMYLCRELLGLSYPTIGKIFGGKHHSTVINALKNIKKKADTNINMQIMLSDLRIKCLAL